MLMLLNMSSLTMITKRLMLNRKYLNLLYSLQNIYKVVL